MRKRLSEFHPAFYHARIWQKRMSRRLSDAAKGRFTSQRSDEDLKYTCKKHQSLLRRRLGDSDPELQENKVHNLKLAGPHLDGLLIRPGETFSFWRTVGETTAAKGYLEGMQLSRGEVVRGVGGGLCQLSNLLYWMALHTPLEVIERHHHSFDPFPDENRTLPFGSGCGVFYNYIDLRFFNPTEMTFQLRVRVGEEHLKGAILTDTEPLYSYHVFEQNHRFISKEGKNYRENEIWREVIDRRTGNRIAEELLVKNHAEVKYELNFAAAACNV
jgi:vancomycin resistance protein VanW